jgi:hypothetical protein
MNPLYLVFHKHPNDVNWQIDMEYDLLAAMSIAKSYQDHQNKIAIVCNVNTLAQIAKAIAEERKDQ